MIYTETGVPISKHIRIKKQNRSKFVCLVTGRKGDRKGNKKDVTVNIGKW